MPNPKIIALTGATGFVGKIVVRELLKKGYHIQALVRPGSHGKTVQDDRIQWVEGTLGDLKSETALCKGVDMVIHMAGLVTTRTKAEYYRINADAVGSLAKAANKAGVKRFVYLSSITAQQPQLSDYAGSKRAGEGALSRKLGRMKGVVMRAPAVFGLGDVVTAPFYGFIRKGRLPVPGGRAFKTRKISLLYVDDLAEYLTGACLDGSCDGRTVSIATRPSLTWQEFAEECSLAVGRPVKTLRLPLFVLYPIAAINTVTKRVFGIGHLTLGKLREFLYEDWSIDIDLSTGTDLQSVLRKTILDA